MTITFFLALFSTSLLSLTYIAFDFFYKYRRRKRLDFDTFLLGSVRKM